MLASNKKRVVKGKNFPFIRRQTTHRPEKKFRPNVFQIPLYAALCKM